MKLLLTLLALSTPAAALAANDVALTSQVFIEKSVPDAAGHVRTVLAEPSVVVPGDHLLFQLGYRNVGRSPATNFVVTNPLPQSVVLQGAPEDAVVSVDGGKSWGALPALRVRAADGSSRAAQAQDVTHIRWAMRAPIPVGASGHLSFRGVVR